MSVANPRLSTDLPSNADVAESPFDLLPDEIVSLILSFAWPSHLITVGGPYNSALQSLLRISTRIRLLVLPFRYCSIDADKQSLLYLLWQPWSHPHVRTVTIVLNPEDSKEAVQYQSACLRLFVNVREVKLSVSTLYNEYDDDGQEVKLPPYPVPEYLTRTLLGYDKLASLDVDEPVKFLDSSFKLANLSSLRTLRINSRCEDLSRLLADCTQLRSFPPVSLPAKLFPILPCSTLRTISVSAQSLGVLEALQAVVFLAGVSSSLSSASFSFLRLTFSCVSSLTRHLARSLSEESPLGRLSFGTPFPAPLRAPS